MKRGAHPTPPVAATPLRLVVLRAMLVPKCTQAKAARLAEGYLPKGQTLSRSRYWQIEAGEGSAPSDDEKRAIARALGTTVEAIEWPTVLQSERRAS